MGFNQFMLGSPSRFQQIDKFTPGQTDDRNLLRQLGMAGLQERPSFEPIAQAEINRHQKETIPALMERFAGMGTGTQRSSGMHDALSRTSEDLGINLAGMRSQYDLQGRNELMQMLGIGLEPQQDTAFFADRPGFMAGVAPGIGEGFGKALPYIGAAAFSGASNLVGRGIKGIGGLIGGGGTPGAAKPGLGGLLPMAGKGAAGGLVGGPLGAIAAMTPDAISNLIKLFNYLRGSNSGSITADKGV